MCCRLDSLNLLTDLADLADLMFSLYLASDYHQVDMDPRYYTYLEFQWEGEFYVFTCRSCFCPLVLHKNMGTISLYLRFRGVRFINYLDDFLFLISVSLWCGASREGQVRIFGHAA